MSLPLSTSVVPLGLFPIADIDHVKGGAMIKADIAARDAIPAASRKESMEVIVKSTGLTYILSSDLLSWTIKASPVATSFDVGPVKPDGVTIVVDLQGRMSALLPKFSVLGSVLAIVNDQGETQLDMNWDGTITNWASIDTNNDAAVVTIGNLKALGLLPT